MRPQMRMTYPKTRSRSTFPLAMLAVICLASGAVAAKPDKNQPDPYYDIDPLEAAQNQHYRQPYRPQFHYTPIQGIIGDATGLLLSQGGYHLFYMSDKWERRKNRHRCWGHAISRDLLHWEELPSILDPVLDNKPGSGIVDLNNTLNLQSGKQPTLAVFYTDYRKGSCIAYSNDAGRTWTRHSRNPALAGVNDIRDPYVFWHAPSVEWRMVRYETKGFAFYGSTDLFRLEAAGPRRGFLDYCPDFFELPVQGSSGRKWVLMEAGGIYQIGAFDGRKFLPETEKLKVEHSKSFYAQQTWKTPSEHGSTVTQMAYLRILWNPV